MINYGYYFHFQVNKRVECHSFFFNFNVRNGNLYNATKKHKKICNSFIIEIGGVSMKKHGTQDVSIKHLAIVFVVSFGTNDFW